MKTLLTLNRAKSICSAHGVKWDGCTISELSYVNSNTDIHDCESEFVKLITVPRLHPFVKGNKVAHARKNMSGEFLKYTSTGTAAVIWFGQGYSEVAPKDLVPFDLRFPKKETMAGWSGVLKLA